jgi:ADP-ribose pyrophosphatase
MNEDDVEKKVLVDSVDRRYDEYLQVDRYRLRHSRFDGGLSMPIQRDLVERGHAVAVLPYDPARDEVVLIEQFRIGPFAHGGDPWMIEIVAGLIEASEDIHDVARRETLEEAGLEVSSLRQIGQFYASPGIMSEHVTLFLGLVDASNAGGIHGLDHEGEDIRVFAVSAEAAIELVRRGSIQSPPALFALQWFALNHGNLSADGE